MVRWTQAGAAGRGMLVLVLFVWIAGCLDPGVPWMCPDDPCRVTGVVATLGFAGPFDEAATGEAYEEMGYAPISSPSNGSRAVFEGNDSAGNRVLVVHQRDLGRASAAGEATFLVTIERRDPAGPLELAPSEVGPYLADRRQAERLWMEAFWQDTEAALDWEREAGPTWAPLFSALS